MKSILRALAILQVAWSLSAADAPAQFPVGTVSFTRPGSWEWVEVSSSMRKAQLKVTDPKSKAVAEVVFFHFGPNNGGGTQANVSRWLGQFVENRDQIGAKVEPIDVGATKVTYVQAEGTYKSGMPGGPQTPLPNHALLGAIVEAEGGSVFIRLTGPKDFAKSLSPEFRKLVESGLKK